MEILAAYLARLWGTIALACPLCHTTTAQEVRAGLLATAREPSIWLALFLPFLTIGAVAAALQRDSSAEISPYDREDYEPEY